MAKFCFLLLVKKKRQFISILLLHTFPKHKIKMNEYFICSSCSRNMSLYFYCWLVSYADIFWWNLFFLFLVFFSSYFYVVAGGCLMVRAILSLFQFFWVWLLQYKYIGVGLWFYLALTKISTAIKLRLISFLMWFRNSFNKIRSSYC